MKNFSSLQKSSKTRTKKRSPLFYVGDKYKLMPQLNKLFPDKINTFYDVFAGGGSVSMNTTAKNFVLNDIDTNVIDIHRYLSNHLSRIDNENVFFNNMYNLINEYGLTHSESKLPENIDEIKKIYPKTYFSHINKEAYLHLRKSFNESKNRLDKLYLLLVYGFNHMIRFNKSGNFNLPVGNVDWNKNVTNSLQDYAYFIQTSNVFFENLDFEQFILNHEYNKDDFLYFDPPYLITSSEYNKLWNKKTEQRLFDMLDKLNDKGIKWGLSEIVTHKGKINEILIDWSQKYDIHEVSSNYISRFDNTKKEGSREIYVTNI